MITTEKFSNDENELVLDIIDQIGNHFKDSENQSLDIVNFFNFLSFCFIHSCATTLKMPFEELLKSSNKHINKLYIAYSLWKEEE